MREHFEKNFNHSDQKDNGPSQHFVIETNAGCSFYPFLSGADTFDCWVGETIMSEIKLAELALPAHSETTIFQLPYKFKFLSLFFLHFCL